VFLSFSDVNMFVLVVSLVLSCFLLLINLQASQVIHEKCHVHRTLWFACSMHCPIRTFSNMTLRPLDFIFGLYFVYGVNASLRSAKRFQKISLLKV
jgi:hypothetical protein